MDDISSQQTIGCIMNERFLCVQYLFLDVKQRFIGYDVKNEPSKKTWLFIAKHATKKTLSQKSC
jgi:hypothetical protein